MLSLANSPSHNTALPPFLYAARTGVRARVKFEFMYRPEFLQRDTKVLFTEGKTKDW